MHARSKRAICEVFLLIVLYYDVCERVPVDTRSGWVSESQPPHSLIKGGFDMKKIETASAPSAIGPYSQAYLSNNTLFISGQLGVVPQTGELPSSVEEQADQACRNVGAILSAAGLSFDHVVKTTCFLADISDFAAFNEVYAKYFVSKPARSCVAVKDLPKGALCEIETIAEV